MHLSTRSVLMISVLFGGCTIHKDLLTGGAEDGTTGAEPVLTSSSSGPGPTTGGAEASTTGVTTGATDNVQTTSGADATTTGLDVTSEGVLTIGDEGCNFLCPTTGGGGCGDLPGLDDGLTSRCTSCDPFAQDCPPGEKCTAWAEDEVTSYAMTRCVPVGDKLPGEACTAEKGFASGDDDCSKGSMCWDLGPDNIGTCVPLCGGTPDAATCGDPSTTCALSNQAKLNLCLPTCDPLMQDCGDNDLCLEVSGSFVCVGDPQPGAGMTDAPCERADECTAGFTCRDPSTSSSACDLQAPGCCQPFCPFPGGPCPSPEQACVQYFDPSDLPENDLRLAIGVCGIP